MVPRLELRDLKNAGLRVYSFGNGLVKRWLLVIFGLLRGVLEAAISATGYAQQFSHYNVCHTGIANPYCTQKRLFPQPLKSHRIKTSPVTVHPYAEIPQINSDNVLATQHKRSDTTTAVAVGSVPSSPLRMVIMC